MNKATALILGLGVLACNPPAPHLPGFNGVVMVLCMVGIFFAGIKEGKSAWR